MRDLEVIYNEVSKQCHKDNCQSTLNIAVLAMEKSIGEYKASVIEKLEALSNSYVVSNGAYVIEKHTLDNFIERLENEDLK